MIQKVDKIYLSLSFFLLCPAVLIVISRLNYLKVALNVRVDKENSLESLLDYSLLIYRWIYLLLLVYMHVCCTSTESSCLVLGFVLLLYLEMRK